MAVAETCGHDRRGKELQDDDILKVADGLKHGQRKMTLNFNGILKC